MNNEHTKGLPTKDVASKTTLRNLISFLNLLFSMTHQIVMAIVFMARSISGIDREDNYFSLMVVGNQPIFEVHEYPF